MESSGLGFKEKVLLFFKALKQKEIHKLDDYTADPSIPKRVQKTIGAINNYLGNRFTLYQLMEFIVELKDKELIIEYCELPPGTYGCCISLTDVNAIFIRHDLSEDRKLLTQLHELAHVLLGHLKTLNCTWQEVIDNPQLLEDKLFYRDNTYDRPYEIEAEAVATILLSFILDANINKYTPLLALERRDLDKL